MFNANGRYARVGEVRLLILRILQCITAGSALYGSLGSDNFAHAELASGSEIILNSTERGLGGSSSFLVAASGQIRLTTSDLFCRVLNVFFGALVIFINALTLRILPLSRDLSNYYRILLINAHVLRSSNDNEITFRSDRRGELRTSRFVSRLLNSILNVRRCLINVT